MSRSCLPLLALLVAILLAPCPADAQVRRCVDGQGNSVFTDRECSSVNATPRGEPAAAGGAYASGFAGSGCARNAQQLLDRVRNALEARDVNRLASHYHWTGTGSGSARSLMNSLEAIANRPLVGVELVFPDLPEPGLPDGFPPLSGDPEPETIDSAAPAPQRPTSIRVEQMSSASDAGSRQTVFQLRRNAGCWWIQL